MEAPRSSNNAMFDAATHAKPASMKAIAAGIALALVLCLGAWGAHAADPIPANPNTMLRATAVDEAVVAVVADHAIVQVDGQSVTGTGFKAPAGKPLTFSAYAEEGYEITDVFVSDIDGAGVPITGGLPTFTIDAAGVVDGLTIQVSTADAHPNAGLFEDGEDDGADEAAQLVEAVVAGQSAEYVYDGEAHTVAFEVLDGNGQPIEGYFAVATTPQFVDVTNGAVDVPASDVTIYDAEGNDVTAAFDYSVQPGSLAITPAPVTIVTPSASKVYDGTPLTADELQLDIPGIEEFIEVAMTIAATGSQTQIGQSANTYSIDWGSVNPANYQVTETLGTLAVSANEAPIVITLHDASRAYNGEPFTSADFDLAAPSGYRAEVKASGSQTDVGTSENAVESYRIFDAQGNDVTSTFSDVTTVAGKLTVEPAELMVATPSAHKTYDGKPLTATATDWVQGFVAGETATCTITGSQTQPGSSLNTYTIEWDGTAKESNYKVIADVGVLEVAEAPAASNDAGNNSGNNAGSGGTSASDNASATLAASAASGEEAVEEEAAEEEVVVEEVVTVVDAPVYESAPVSSTPNVVYLTPANDAGSSSGASSAAASAANANGPQSSTASSAGNDREASSSSAEASDAGAAESSVVTTGANGTQAQEEAVVEEVLYDDATPLAGVEEPSNTMAVSPWIALGIILLAAILALLFFLLRNRRKDNGAA